MSGQGRSHVYFRLREPGKPERILVFDTQELTVGRAKDNDLRADYAELSRSHAVFSRTGQSYSVQNRSTSNATLVNGEPVKTHALAVGDVIRIAEFELSFEQTSDNPATLAAAIEYVSQLKGFGPADMQAADGESTVLGLMDSAEGGDFEVRPANDFEYELNELGGAPESIASAEARDLDLELEGFGLDDIEAPGPVAAGDATLERAIPVAREPDAKTRPIEDLQAPNDEVWTLEEEPEPVAAPAAPAAVPVDPPPAAPRRAAAPTQAAAKPAVKPAAPSAAGALSITLELEGLTPELHQTLRALFGKVITLPALRVRVKGEDLG